LPRLWQAMSGTFCAHGPSHQQLDNLVPSFSGPFRHFSLSGITVMTTGSRKVGKPEMEVSHGTTNGTIAERWPADHFRLLSQPTTTDDGLTFRISCSPAGCDPQTDLLNLYASPRGSFGHREYECEGRGRTSVGGSTNSCAYRNNIAGLFIVLPFLLDGTLCGAYSVKNSCTWWSTYALTKNDLK
jgi:hypothetical protein